MKTYGAKIRSGKTSATPTRSMEIRYCSIGVNLPLISNSKRIAEKEKRAVRDHSRCYRTRIRTWTNRTKTCCATITPYDNPYLSKGTSEYVPDLAKILKIH